MPGGRYIGPIPEIAVLKTYTKINVYRGLFFIDPDFSKVTLTPSWPLSDKMAD
jgi:hypothetical protein